MRKEGVIVADLYVHFLKCFSLILLFYFIIDISSSFVCICLFFSSTKFDKNSQNYSQFILLGTSLKSTDILSFKFNVFHVRALYHIK
jgi:hypothetical protein